MVVGPQCNSGRGNKQSDFGCMLKVGFPMEGWVVIHLHEEEYG